MNPVDAGLLGVLEGLTEFLPVSSTGHLILLGELLGHGGPAAKAFDIVIQLGAIVAVAVYFRRTLVTVGRGIVQRRADSWRLLGALTAAFVPTAIVGLSLHKLVKQYLFGLTPVAAALLVGGLIMIAVEFQRKRRGLTGLDGLEHVTIGRGFVIGLAQCLSLWPGASRSMTTIVGGQLCGLSTKTAAEFSFLLAIPTLGAATVFDLLKSWDLLMTMPGGATALIIGLATSFVVGWLVVALFIRYLGRAGLTPFGVYRIALAIAVLLWGQSALGAPAPTTPALTTPQPQMTTNPSEH